MIVHAAIQISALPAARVRPDNILRDCERCVPGEKETCVSRTGSADVKDVLFIYVIVSAGKMHTRRSEVETDKTDDLVRHK